MNIKTSERNVGTKSTENAALKTMSVGLVIRFLLQRNKTMQMMTTLIAKLVMTHLEPFPD